MENIPSLKEILSGLTDEELNASVHYYGNRAHRSYKLSRWAIERTMRALDVEDITSFNYASGIFDQAIDTAAMSSRIALESQNEITVRRFLNRGRQIAAHGSYDDQLYRKTS